MKKSRNLLTLFTIFILIVVLAGTVSSNAAADQRNADGDGDTTDLPTSILSAPLSDDENFVADTGGELDQYLYASDGDGFIRFHIAIDRYYFNIEDPNINFANGFLTDDALTHIKNKKILPDKANLRLRVWDVDANGTPCPEVDYVYVNNIQIKENGNPSKLTGANADWSTPSFQIPIETLKFPRSKGANGNPPAPVLNEIAIEVDAGGCQTWAVSVDWGEINIPSPIRPIIFAHGWTGDHSGEDSAFGDFEEWMKSDGIPSAGQVDLGRGIYLIDETTVWLKAGIEKAKTEFGVDQLNLFGHSKGGVVIRKLLRDDKTIADQVENVITFASPHHGTDRSWASEIACKNNGFSGEDLKRCITSGEELDTYRIVLFNYSGCKVTWYSAWSDCNPKYIKRANIKYSSFAAEDDWIVDPVKHTTFPWDADDQPFPDTINVDQIFDIPGFNLSDHSHIVHQEDVYQCAISYLNSSIYAASNCPGNTSTPAKESLVNHAGSEFQRFFMQDQSLIAGETITLTSMLDAGQKAIFEVFSTQTISYTLTDPAGGIINPSTAVNDPNITYYAAEDDAFWVYRYEVNPPVSGSWQNHLETSIAVELVVTNHTDSTNQLDFVTDKTIYRPGDTIHLVAALTDGTTPYTNTVVTGLVTYPDDTTTTLAFYDDGTNGDITPGDGFFTSQFPASATSGYARVELSAVSGAIYRELESFIAMTAQTALFQTVTGEFVQDLNTNGLYDILNLDLSIEVIQSGHFEIQGTLVDGSGVPITYGSFSTRMAGTGPLPVGLQTINLSFDGKQIYLHGQDGPYTLTNIIITDVTGPALEVDRADNAYTTAAYSVDDFEHPLITLTGGSEAVIDTNANGLYDILQINLNMDFVYPGEYKANGRLVDSNGTEIVWAQTTISLTTSGPGVFQLDFDGYAVGFNHIDGPYRLVDLSIFSTTNSSSALFRSAYQTQPYAYSEFEGGGGNPVIMFAPASMLSTQAGNTTITQTLTISNAGSGLLHWSIDEDNSPGTSGASQPETPGTSCDTPEDIPWLSLSPTASSTPPGFNSYVDVIFNSYGLSIGSYDAVLCINSNDSSNPLVSVPVSMQVTTSPPGAFSKTSPVNGAQNISTSPTLTWQPSSGADSYEYCYDTTNDNACSTWMSNGSTTSVDLAGLSTGTLYFWHVRANNSGGTTYANGGSSIFWQFTTASPVIIVSPDNLSAIQYTNLTTTQTLTIQNTGAITLNWTIDEDNSPGAFFDHPFLDGSTGLLDGAGLSAAGSGQGVSVTNVSSVDQTLTTITQSLDPATITQLNSVSCNAGGLHADNAYLRAFNLDAFGLTTGFDVTEVEIGIESAASAGGTGQPLTINLYQWDGVSAFTYANLLPGLVGTASVSVPDQALSLYTIPVTGSVAGGQYLVVEIFTPDGQSDGHSFFIGSNAAGETGPSYIAAAACGITEPTTLSSIGFPNTHVLMSVTGDVPTGDTACDAPEDVPWLSLSDTSGSTSPLSDFPVTVTFNSTGLAVGTYNAALCIHNNDALNPLVSVPVSMDVTTPPPEGFTKSGPANGGLNITDNPTLTWMSSTGATSYEYCYDTTDDDSCSNWIGTGTAISVTLSNLILDTSYYWQVRANNAGGTTYANGSSSAYWQFTTGSRSISLLPNSLNAVQYTNQTTTQTLSIQNGGTLSLTWSIFEDNSPLTSPDYSGIVNPDADLSGSGLTGPNVFPSPNIEDPLVMITQSSSQTINPGNSVACSGGSGSTTDNQYLRAFDLSSYGISGDFHVTSLEFGVEQASSTSGFQSVTVNLYEWDSTSALMYANLNLVGTNTISMSDQNLTLVNIPVNATISTGMWMVAEVALEDTTGLAAFFIGSNNLGQTGASYIATTSCGFPDPVDLASIGFPDMMVVMNVYGDEGGDPLCNTTDDIPWVTTNPTTGATVPGGSDDITVTFDSTGLSIGTYNAALCVNSNDPLNPTVPVSVSLQVEVSPPAAFSKSSPVNGAVNVSPDPTLTWQSSQGADSYEYCYDTSNDNSCSTWTDIGNTTSIGLSGLSPGTTYYWHVRATNDGGTTYANNSSTAFWSFTIITPPSAFSKIAPVDGSTSVSTNPSLIWEASAGAAMYEYCYDTTNDNSCAPWISAGTNTSINLSGLAEGTTYFWHVRASNAGGTTYANGNSNTYWSFTTLVSPPESFDKLSPNNGESEVPFSLNLSWQTSTGAVSYEYCYDTSNDNTCANWINVGNSTTISLSGLTPSTTYFWHVRAINSGGTTYSNGSSTSYWSFTTKNYQIFLPIVTR